METLTDKMTVSNSRNIHILNDDCLLHIFYYLPIEDKLRVEEVCKRWKHLSPLTWKQYRNKNLALSHPSWDLPLSTIASMDDCTLSKIISRVARYITTIDLTRPFFMIMDREIELRVLCDIFEQCNNIQTLYLTNGFKEEWTVPLFGKIRNKDELEYEEFMKWLKHYANQLTKFGYGSQFRVISDNDFLDLLAMMKNLKHCFIDSIVGEKFLKHLPSDTLEELIMENCGLIHLDFISELFKNSTKLHTFCSSGLTTDDTLNLPKNAPIKNLGITMAYLTENPNWSKSVDQLINIEKLNVELNDNIDDAFLNVLATKCKKITFLNISGCSRVTDKGTKNLKTLPNLQHLAIAGSHNITGKYLGIMPNLELLDCNNCEKITDDALLGIVQYSSRLRILNLSGCSLITNSLMRTAINATRRRENGIILYVSIDQTEIKLKELKKKSPMLKTEKTIYYVVECNSNYNGYFPTIYDFFTDLSPNESANSKSRNYKRIITD